MDLSLPGLLASTLVGSVGYVLFHFGRKCARTPQLASGLLLMLFPLFVPSVGWMLGIAALILAGLWGSLRLGL